MLNLKKKKKKKKKKILVYHFYSEHSDRYVLANFGDLDQTTPKMRPYILSVYTI